MIGALQGQRLAQDGSCSRRVAPPITCRFHFDHTGTLFFIFTNTPVLAHVFAPYA